MALLVLLVLSSILLALASLTATEPVIAANHARGSAARALAESGLERALWSLLSDGTFVPPTSGISATYDGSTLYSIDAAGLGQFTVRMTGMSPKEVRVRAVGRHRMSASDSAPSRRVVEAVFEKFTFGQTSCALCVRGDLRLNGSERIDARPEDPSEPGCTPGKKGAITTGMPHGEPHGAVKVWGQDGDTSDNEAGEDYAILSEADMNAEFAAFSPSAAQLESLRAMARQNGSYYQTDNGFVDFNSSTTLPDGVVFVDVGLNGNPASVNLSGAGNAGVWKGWLIVMGDLSITGNMDLTGVIYATGAVNVQSGTPRIHGVVIMDSVNGMSGQGNVNLQFNCSASKGKNIVPAWVLQPGSYRELPGSS